jgi:hypothetical protein
VINLSSEEKDYNMVLSSLNFTLIALHDMLLLPQQENQNHCIKLSKIGIGGKQWTVKFKLCTGMELGTLFHLKGKLTSSTQSRYIR